MGAARPRTVGVLGNYRRGLLLLRLDCMARNSGKLQDCRLLSLGQVGEKHCLPVGELQRVVVGYLCHVDLAEDRRAMCRLARAGDHSLIRVRRLQSE
jgi:hypothetical protein